MKNRFFHISQLQILAQSNRVIYNKRMNTNTMLKTIKLICNELEIQEPVLNIVDELEGTQLANYNYKTKTLTVKSKYESPYDAIFAIAHELRHKYQHDYHIMDFSTYKSRDKLDLVSYNLQLIELDANAYAYIFMTENVGVKPLFQGVNPLIKEKIMDRVIYIYATEY